MRTALPISPPTPPTSTEIANHPAHRCAKTPFLSLLSSHDDRSAPPPPTRFGSPLPRYDVHGGSGPPAYSEVRAVQNDPPPSPGASALSRRALDCRIEVWARPTRA